MRSLVRNGGVLLIVGLLVFAGMSLSQPKPPAQAPRTRIGLINLARLFREYQKVVKYSADNKKLLKPFEEKSGEIKHNAETLVKELDKKDLAEDKRAEFEKKLKECHRQMEEVNHEAKMLLTKKNEEQMVLVFKDVTAAARRWAKAHDIDLVMHYSDMSPEDPEYYSPGNIDRKIQARGLVPDFIAPGMDITRDVVADLNQRLREGKEATDPKEE